MLIGVRCLKFVQNQLRIPVEKKYLFSDSKCVLGWIASKKQLPVFVQNRVTEIKLHEDIDFSYVQTDRNPADVANRVCSRTLYVDKSLKNSGN